MNRRLSIDVLTMDGALLQASLFETWENPGGRPGARAIVTVSEGKVASAIRYLRRRCREICGPDAIPQLVRKDMKTRARLR